MIVVYKPTKEEFKNFVDTISEAVLVGLMASEIPSDNYTMDDVVKINKAVVGNLIHTYDIDIDNIF